MDKSIILAEQAIVYWAKRCAEDMKFYTGLMEAIEARDKAVLNLMIELRYGS